MPAVSKKQQRFMGMVHALNKGEINPSDVSKDVQDVAKDMKKKDAKDFASTKHKGLPMKKEQMINRLKEMIKQELSEYTYGVGDIVKDVNPSCLHYGAIGKVKEVNPEYVTFVVTNNGDNFSKGQTLEKSHDQMKKVNESTARTDKSIGTKNYKGVGWFWPNDGWKHYLRDVENAGRKEVHDLWLKAGFEVKKDNRGIPHFDIKPNQRNKAMDIVNKLDRSKKYKHANESVNEATFTPIDKIKDIKNLVKKGLVSYRGASGGFEIAIRNKKVSGFPPSSELLYSGDPKKQKQYSDIRKKQFSIKPIATYFIKSDDLRKLQNLGQVSFLAPNKKEPIRGESVNEANPKDTIATIDMVNALLKIKSPMSRQTLDALKMMVRHYGLDNIKKEVQRDARKFYKSLQKMEKGLTQDIELESIIKEDYFVNSGQDFSKNFLTGIDLVISQANNLKGQLAKHPVKRDINKLKAVQTIYKKFLQPSIDKQSDRFKAVNLTRLKDFLKDGKFRNAIQFEILSALDTRSYNSNSYYFLDDKHKELVKKLTSSLKDITNKLEKGQFESVNEASVSQVRSTISRVKKQLMQKWAKKGGYENFGQKELRNLKDKFKENPYGSPEERQISQMLSSFDNWAKNYSGDMRESVNEGKGVDKIMKIVDTQSFGKLAGQTVDTLSASLFKQVYDKASQGAKDKINQMNERQLLVFMNKLWMRFGKGLSGQMMS
jgi:hypothetical protein